jgi:hypothetical protein
MNVFEEYASRKKISYPIAYHTSSSLIIFESDKRKWNAKLCVLTVVWNSNPHHPGMYKICLRSPYNNVIPQSLLHLDKTHFFVEKSWFEYEEFFYKWKPSLEGLRPVYDSESLLSAWEIFVSVNECLFLNQSTFVKKKLFETLDPTATPSERLASLSELTSSSSFDHMLGAWKKGFLAPIEEDYMNWYKKFIGLYHEEF